jgi:hypothetical protein
MKHPHCQTPRVCAGSSFRFHDSTFATRNWLLYLDSGFNIRESRNRKLVQDSRLNIRHGICLKLPNSEFNYFIGHHQMQIQNNFNYFNNRMQFANPQTRNESRTGSEFATSTFNLDTNRNLKPKTNVELVGYSPLQYSSSFCHGPCLGHQSNDENWNECRIGSAGFASSTFVVIIYVPQSSFSTTHNRL